MIELYKNLINEVLDKKNEYKESDLVVFPSMKGDKYNNNLMIVGRAVNDWNLQFNKNETNTWDHLKNDISKQLGSGDFKWADGKYAYKKDEYNPNKSAFWRVAKKLSQIINNINDSPSEYIVYSNLYKVAKANGGNPSERLATAQYQSCINLLIEELEFYKPKHVVFLTGKNWAKELFVKMPLESINEIENDQVYLIANYNSSNLIVVDHPQGKNEGNMIKAILEIIQTNSL